MTLILSTLEFPHSPPKGYSYHLEQHNLSTISIWLVHHREYVYNESDSNVKTIWGFVKTSKKSKSITYYSPINSKKIGKEVKLEHTTPYTSMQLSHNPLMQAFL